MPFFCNLFGATTFCYLLFHFFSSSSSIRLFYSIYLFISSFVVVFLLEGSGHLDQSRCRLFCTCLPLLLLLYRLGPLLLQTYLYLHLWSLSLSLSRAILCRLPPAGWGLPPAIFCFHFRLLLYHTCFAPNRAFLPAYLFSAGVHFHFLPFLYRLPACRFSLSFYLLHHLHFLPTYHLPYITTCR